MSMTPYRAAKIVNAILAENGVEKVLPTQMFYNYTVARIRSNKKPFIQCDKDNRITEDGLKLWLSSYLPKQGIKIEK